MLNDNIVTHDAGVYFACYRLSCLNWRISHIMQGKQKLHEIQRGNKRFIIHIRSLTKITSVPFPQELDILDCIYYLVICNNLHEKLNIIAIKSQKAKDIFHKDTKNEKTCWLQDANYNEHGLNFDQELGEE